MSIDQILRWSLCGLLAAFLLASIVRVSKAEECTYNVEERIQNLVDTAEHEPEGFKAFLVQSEHTKKWLLYIFNSKYPGKKGADLVYEKAPGEET